MLTSSLDSSTYQVVLGLYSTSTHTFASGNNIALYLPYADLLLTVTLGDGNAGTFSAFVNTSIDPWQTKTNDQGYYVFQLWNSNWSGYSAWLKSIGH